MIRRYDHNMLPLKHRTHLAYTPWEAQGKAGWAIDGNCDNCVQLEHTWRSCPRLGEAGKVARAQRKGQKSKGNPKGYRDERNLEGADLDQWD